MDYDKLLFICIILSTFILSKNLVNTLSSNETVKIPSNSTTNILQSNGSKNGLVSEHMNNTSNGLGVRFLNGNSGRRGGKGAAFCQDGAVCAGPECCRYKITMQPVCENKNCWRGDVNIIAKGFKFTKPLRKTFVEVVGWFREMWYKFAETTGKVIRLRDMEEMKIGKNTFISMNNGWMRKKIYMKFYAPIYMTKQKAVKYAPHIENVFHLQFSNSWFGYEFNFHYKREGRNMKGRVSINFRNVFIRLVFLILLNDVCPASKYDVTVITDHAHVTTAFHKVQSDKNERKVPRPVKQAINAYIYSVLLQESLIPAVKHHFSNFLKYTKPKLYPAFKGRGIDLCKEAAAMFNN